MTKLKLQLTQILSSTKSGRTTESDVLDNTNNKRKDAKDIQITGYWRSKYLLYSICGGHFKFQ